MVQNFCCTQFLLLSWMKNAVVIRNLDLEVIVSISGKLNPCITFSKDCILYKNYCKKKKIHAK